MINENDWQNFYFFFTFLKGKGRKLAVSRYMKKQETKANS